MAAPKKRRKMLVSIKISPTARRKTAEFGPGPKAEEYEPIQSNVWDDNLRKFKNRIKGFKNL